jgi:hypothetical protein
VPPEGTPGLLLDRLRGEDVDEDDHEQQVDEVHGFYEADRQEEVLTGLPFDLGLPGDRRDRLATCEAVTYCGANGATAECQATADERTRYADCPFDCVCCHVSSFVQNC